MDQTEIIIFILLTTVVVIIFLIAVVTSLVRYREKKKEAEQERQQAEEKHQQELLAAQLQSQQQTMQHIGTEIHDNVGQKLTLASLYTKQLAAGTGTSLEHKIAEVGNIIDESLTELRQLSKTLTNPELANASLLFLLKEEARRINVSGFCQVSVQHTGGDIVLPQADKNILFRLLQEFMQNSLKHSDCSKITLSLKKEANTFLVIATDDGKGFDTSAASGGIGLQNMKRRAAQLQAVYQLTSEAGKGTTLSLQLPTEK